MPIVGRDYMMTAMVRVYSTPDMDELPIYEFPIDIPNSDLSKGPFLNMYTALKALFPMGVEYQPN